MLPVWAHRRGKSYPKIVFYDSKPDYQDSLGFHELTSSNENYFCRPLLPSEHETIQEPDVMTCPSPQVFRTDKGRFADDNEKSVYPPRNNITSFDADRDHDDVKSFSSLNDLDAVTGATPMPELQTLTLIVSEEEMPSSKLVAWVEVSLENDQNKDWQFDREEDHYIDPKLSNYGVSFLGQPSVVYRVAFDPTQAGFHTTLNYAGYGDWDGQSGTLHEPDDSISTSKGSGADRLKLAEIDSEKEKFRFAVLSSGLQTPGENKECSQELPPIEILDVEPLSFDQIRIHFKFPDNLEEEVDVTQLKVYFQTNAKELDPDAALEAPNVPPICNEITDGDESCIDPHAKSSLSVDIRELFGDYNYAFGLDYQDACANASRLATASATTPKQEFQTIDTFCFIATAAYGVDWAAEIGAFRYFRDRYLKSSPFGRDVIRFYYAYGPSLAKVIRQHDGLRAATRELLSPVAQAIQKFE